MKTKSVPQSTTPGLKPVPKAPVKAHRYRYAQSPSVDVGDWAYR